MKYTLWIDGKNAGPYGPAEIRKMLHEGFISENTLARPEDGPFEWGPLGKFAGIINPSPAAAPPPAVESAPPPLPASAAKPEPVPPTLQKSSIALLLQCFAILEFGGALLGGLLVGSADNGSAGLGWLVFISGVLSGLFMLGFAAIIENTSESSQRLHRIELLLQKPSEGKLPIPASSSGATAVSPGPPQTG